MSRVNAIERELEYASDSDSTASDLTGPGRLVDRIIGSGGARIEKLVNGQSAIRNKLDVLPGSQLSFVTDSNATCSDNDGAGRTVGRGISWGAKYVERIATWAATRAGRSPTSPMRKIRKMLAEDPTAPVHCQFCGHRYTPSPSNVFPHSPAPADTMYGPLRKPAYGIPHTPANSVLKTRSHAPMCPSCMRTQNTGAPRNTGAKEVRKALRKLVSRIK